MIETDPKNKEWFEREFKIHEHEGNEEKEFMQYWYKWIDELETGKFGLKAKQDLIVDTFKKTEYEAADEESLPRLINDAKKYSEYNSSDKEELETKDKFLRAHKMTIESFGKERDLLMGKMRRKDIE